MDKIGLLYICTGEYKVFWKDFYESFQTNFLTESEIFYFVFTDADDLFGYKENPHIKLIYQKNLGWPGNTLFRYKIFVEHKELFQQMDYLYFMNANTLCMKKITEEEFIPKDEKLLFVQHPGYYAEKNYLFPYERRKKSLAYIPYADGKVYVCGGINGGERETYIKLCECLMQRIDTDYAKGVIALWHDESQINRYVLDQKTYRLLPPAYCYPEGVSIPFENRIMVRDKSKVIDVGNIKGNKEKYNIFVNECRYILQKIRIAYLKHRYDLCDESEKSK